MNINSRIKAVRNATKLTQVQFAEKIGIEQSSLSFIEGGRTKNIDERNIRIICKEFRVNEEWLRNGIGEMFNNEKDLLSLMNHAIDSLDATDKKIIYEYIKLTPGQRKIMKDFIRKIF
jgi:transcriptional regulator with XRE-family HTH domain